MGHAGAAGERDARRLVILIILGTVLLAAAAGCGRRDEAVVSRKPAKAGADKAGGKPVSASAEAHPGQASVSTADGHEAEPEKTAGPLIEIDQKTITLRWVEKGLLRMRATAREGRINELTKTGMLTDFTAELYENGKLTTTMTAPRVVADTVNRVVTATGGVTMKSMVRNTVLKAEWVKWFAREHKVIGDGGVTIKSDVWDMKSAAFVADTGLKTLTLKNSAKGLAPQ